MEEKDIIRRNKRVLKFFEILDLDVKLYGNINNPAVIYRNHTALSCYVHNFNLIFTDKPKSGKEIFRYKLLDEQLFNEQQVDLIYDWLHNYTHRSCFAVGVVGTNLRLSGYNFINKERLPENQYPVFSEFDYKLYFDKEYAEGIVNDYSTDSLMLELI